MSSASISDSTNMSLLHLPIDIILSILELLNISDLHNVMLTCKTLRELIINDNSIWRAIGRNKLIIQNNSADSHSVALSYYNRSRISKNWIRGFYRNKVVVYHNTKYMPWLQLYCNGLLVSAGSELRCYVMDKNNIPHSRNVTWRLQVPKIKRNDVRTNDISRFIAKHDVIACGNRDGCVAVYSLDNIKFKPDLLCHIKDCHENGRVEVTALELINKHNLSIITASDSNSKLHFWSCIPEKRTKTLNEFRSSEIEYNSQIREINLLDCKGVRCLATDYMENKLAIGLNGNSKPQLLDIATGELLMTTNVTKTTRDAVRDIGWFDRNTIMYVTHSGKLQLTDIRTYEVIYDTMDPFQSKMYCVKNDGRYAIVVGSAEYSRCVLFDRRNSARHVQMYFTQRQPSPVYSLDFDVTKLFAAADRSIAALNFNVNPATVQYRDYSHTFELVFR